MSSREVLRDYAEYATPNPVLPEGGDAPIDYYCRSIEMQLVNLQKQITDQRSRDRLELAGKILAAMFANSALATEEVTYKEEWEIVALRHADALLVELDKEAADD